MYGWMIPTCGQKLLMDGKQTILSVDGKLLQMPQKSNVRIFFLSRYGIHWPELDEDLCFEGLFVDAGFCAQSENEDAVYYQA